MIIFNDDMSEAPTKSLATIIGMTKSGAIYIYAYNDDKYRRRGEPSPFWKNSIFGVHWSRANQPVKWAALTEASPMIAVSQVVDKLDEAGAQYFDRTAGAMVAASGLFGGKK